MNLFFSNNHEQNSIDSVSMIELEPDYILNNIKDNSKMEKNIKIPSLVSSVSDEVNVLKMGFCHEEFT